MVEGIAVEIHQHEHDDRRCDDHRPEPPVARSLHFHVAVHSPCSFQIRGQPPLLTPSSETMPEDCRGSFAKPGPGGTARSEEHTSELQSLMRISYAVFCLKKKTTTNNITNVLIHIQISYMS